MTEPSAFLFAPSRERDSFVLSNYKVLQNVTVEVGEYYGREDAVRIIRQCRDAYAATQKQED